ncbi:hypothetical protein COO91_05271 [Nostoc flagelliforme CCNUN1]|uniref:Uncharacterized protein n=1 Tax=Nostoc flagelliforme CCNUN1 TaxID=2038116 RepID=A0A2K8SUZ9_9NOSO|nr:hypothetical protein COO91_05271 [Nostoc flagelliforme CCNUN1]
MSKLSHYLASIVIVVVLVEEKMEYHTTYIGESMTSEG